MGEYLNYKGYKVRLVKIEDSVATLSRIVGFKFQDIKILYQDLMNQGISADQISIKKLDNIYMAEIFIPLSEALQLEAW